MASILTGTPIQTGGIHPFAALMGQGTEILANGFRLAAQRKEAGERMTMDFLRSAMQERIASERQQLEQRQADRNYELQLASMAQRERFHESDLASRERMANARLQAVGSRRSSLSGNPDQAGISNALQSILGSSFAAAAPQAPAASPAAAPQQTAEFSYAPVPNNIMTGAGDGVTGTGMGALDQVKAVAPQAETEVAEAYNKDLSTPQNVDALEQAIMKQNAIHRAGVALSPTIAGQLSYASRAAESAVNLERYRAERSKESSDMNGLVKIDQAVSDRLSPFDGFTGVRFSKDEDLERASQDPDTARALTLLQAGSAQLRKDLMRSEPTLEQVSGLLDKYTQAEQAIQEQLKESQFIAVEGSQPGSRVDARNLVKSRYESSPTVQKIQGHRAVLQEVFEDQIKKADLSKLTGRQLAQAGMTVRRSLAITEGRLVEAREQEQAMDSRIGEMIGKKDWSLTDLNSAIEKQRDPEGGWVGPFGEQLEEERKRFTAIRKEREGLERDFNGQKFQLNSVNQAAGLESPSLYQGDDEIIPSEEDTKEIGRELPLPEGEVLKGKVNDAFRKFEERNIKARGVIGQ